MGIGGSGGGTQGPFPSRLGRTGTAGDLGTLLRMTTHDLKFRNSFWNFPVTSLGRQLTETAARETADKWGPLQKVVGRTGSTDPAGHP